MTGLREHDRRFLAQTGLEVGTFGHIEVDDEGEAMELGVIVGYDGDVEIVCTPRGVVILDGHGEDDGRDPNAPDDDGESEGVGRPVNTSAERYQATLRRYGAYASKVAELRGDARAQAAASAVAEMRAIDPQAWEDPAGYWQIIAGQMLAGER